jgi:hypothetical protein
VKRVVGWALSVMVAIGAILAIPGFLVALRAEDARDRIGD